LVRCPQDRPSQALSKIYRETMLSPLSEFPFSKATPSTTTLHVTPYL
jgi:hypothetical protein